MENQKTFPPVHNKDSNGNNVAFQGSKAGGKVDLALGYRDEEGFYLAIEASAGTQGLLKVVLKGDTNNTDDTVVVLPFFFGWNPILVKEVKVDAGNTAAEVYWVK